MSCELTTEVWTGPSQSASLTPLLIPSQLRVFRSMGKGRKDGSALKQKNPLMRFLRYLKHLQICLQSAAFERILLAWVGGGKAPFRSRTRMSYRHLRGWKSLGPDHGFNIQLQPRPGPRAEPPTPTSPRCSSKRRNMEKLVLIFTRQLGLSFK